MAARPSERTSDDRYTPSVTSRRRQVTQTSLSWLHKACAAGSAHGQLSATTGVRWISHLPIGRLHARVERTHHFLRPILGILVLRRRYVTAKSHIYHTLLQAVATTVTLVTPCHRVSIHLSTCRQVDIYPLRWGWRGCKPHHRPCAYFVWLHRM